MAPWPSLLGQLKDASRPNYVIFLTDGLPTDGETNEAKIVAASKTANGVHARMFTFGVGYDVNSRLLDRLARTNFGQSEYVRPNENIEARVGSLYSHIAAPMMTDVAIRINVDGAQPVSGPDVNRLYPADVHDLFAGEQLVIVGRYKRPGAAKVVVTGKVQGAERSFDFPASLVEKSNDDTNSFVERLWAVRRVGEIIDELDLKGKNDELIKELVDLSIKHGVLTPYTSFLADDQAGRHDLAASTRQASERLSDLSITDGRGGFEQRSLKGSLQRAEQAEAAAKNAADAAPIAGAQACASGSPNQPGFAYGGAGLGSGTGGRRSHASATKQGANGQFNGPITWTDRANDSKDSPSHQVQTIGRKTFFRQQNRWVESGISTERQQQAIKIERYSDAYFELVRRHANDVAKYLTIDEPVTLELDGKVYEF